MDWFPYDNGLRHERVKLTADSFNPSINPLQLSVEFHIETSNLF